MGGLRQAIPEGSPGPNWSVLNVRLYNEAFTGRARAIPRCSYRAIPRCSYCLRDDHAAFACPSNPSRPLLWDTPVWPVPTSLGQASRPVQAEACQNYNDGRCTKFNCQYQHIMSGVPGSSYLDQLNCPRRRSQEPLPSKVCHAWLTGYLIVQFHIAPESFIHPLLPLLFLLGLNHLAVNCSIT